MKVPCENLNIPKIRSYVSLCLTQLDFDPLGCNTFLEARNLFPPPASLSLLVRISYSISEQSWPSFLIVTPMKNSMLARKYFIQHMNSGVAVACSASPSLALRRRSESCNFMAQQPNIITCQTALITRPHLLRIFLSQLPTGQRSGHSDHDALLFALDHFLNIGGK